MRKFVAILLSALLLLSLAACSSVEQNANDDSMRLVILGKDYRYVQKQKNGDDTLKLVDPNGEELSKGELSLNDPLCQKLIKKVTFSQSATSSLYKNGEIDIEDISKDVKINDDEKHYGIPNKLALRLAWSKVKSDKKHYFKKDKKQYVSVSASDLGDCVKELFGPDFEYTDETFNNTNTKSFMNIPDCKGDIVYENGTYTGKVYTKNAEDDNFILQQVTSVKKKDDGIQLSVKTAFVNAEYDETVSSDIHCKFYREYDFDDKEFKFRLINVTADVVLDDINYIDPINPTFCYKPLACLSEEKDNFYTYAYDFEKGSDGEYHLKQFYKK